MVAVDEDGSPVDVPDVVAASEDERRREREARERAASRSR
jgi:acyl-CoA hydrolase